MRGAALNYCPLPASVSAVQAVIKGAVVSRNLSSEQATIRNADEFRRQFSILSQAAVGVVMVRTREPFRAMDELRLYAHAENMGYRTWTIAHGWAIHSRANQDADPVIVPSTVEPVAALRAISPAEGIDEFGNGVFVMMNPHKPITQSVVMVQLLKDYAHNFPKNRKRLVILVPPVWDLPAELEDDIVILQFDPPTYAETRDSYMSVIGPIDKTRQPRYSDIDIDSILAAGAGMTVHEFESALARALIQVRPRLPDVLASEISAIIMGVKTEVVRRSEILEVMPADNIANIGGLENLKGWIRDRAGCFTQEARDAGIDPLKGIALIGPPGTGKSASAKAIASVLGIPLIRFDVGRIFNSLVGESEKRVRAALQMVSAMAPCVLMIDEADKAFAGQARGGGGGDSGTGMRVLGAILTWMQENTSPVFMIVTANRTSGLPSEFLRKGRLDEVFSVTVPHVGERMEVLKIHLRKRAQNPDNIEGLDAVVARADGFVPAEIEAAVKDAMITAFNRKQPLTGEMIAEQFGRMVPLSEAFKEDFEEMQRWAEQNARPASLMPGQTVEAVRVRTRARGAIAGNTLTGRKMAM